MAIWSLTGLGYFKSPNESAKEMEMLLDIRKGGGEIIVSGGEKVDTWSIMLSENREFGWDLLAKNRERNIDEMEGTRGEVVISVNTKQLQELAETILKAIEELHLK